MAAQIFVLPLPNSSINSSSNPLQCKKNQVVAQVFAAWASPVTTTTTASNIQIVGRRRASNLSSKESAYGTNTFESSEGDSDWYDLDADLYYWTKSLRPVQWYPGHIARTEKELKEQLKLMDVVIEVRDARIPLATSHPQMGSWIGTKRRILVLNREDMISTADRNAWATYFARQGTKAIFSNGQLGMGTMKLGRLAKSLAVGVNAKRRAKGLLPRPVGFLA